MTWQIAVEGPLRALDERWSRAVAGRGPEPLTELLADLGNPEVALPVLVAAAGYAWWRGRGDGAWRYAAPRAALAIVAVPSGVVPLKALLDRPGPLTDASGYYPSGHAATAVVAFCAAAVLVRRALPARAALWAMPAAWVLTLATGIGLVLRGYHWPLDVIGSWCLFGALLLVLFGGPPEVSSSGRRRSSGRTRTG
ncbi:phosphatase PAP2 family protein [Streptomyces sp. NPDC058953]|uniref:phosphatase PAP2 family protein n=1 Tax=unclassified Streptomyces TaxID=2593676 RepID=UPI0036B17D87